MSTNLWTIFIIILLFVNVVKSEKSKGDIKTCSVKLNNTLYHIKFSENSDSNENDVDVLQGLDFKTDPFYTSTSHTTRQKRSASSQTSDVEINRLKRKIGRLEKKLSESLEDLTDELKRGFRRMEDKIRDIENPDQSKRVARHLSLDNPCPKDFHPIDVDKLQSCYLLSNFNTTWYESKSYCTALGSHLVSLGSIREHYVLTYLIKNNKEFSQAEGWWTSGTFVSTTKQWMWTTDTYKPFTFIRWAPNQPSDDTSNCVYLRRDTDQLWNDEICTQKFNFVCETCYRCDRHSGY